MEGCGVKFLILQGFNFPILTYSYLVIIYYFMMLGTSWRKWQIDVGFQLLSSQMLAVLRYYFCPNKYTNLLKERIKKNYARCSMLVYRFFLPIKILCQKFDTGKIINDIVSVPTSNWLSLGGLFYHKMYLIVVCEFHFVNSLIFWLKQRYDLGRERCLPLDQVPTMITISF